MGTTEDTQEVDPAELGKEVASELDEKFPRTERSQIKNRVHLKNLDVSNPTKKSTLNMARNKARRLANNPVSVLKEKITQLDSLNTEKTVYREIEKVKPTDEGVRIMFEKSDGSKRRLLWLTDGSSELSNLVRYVGVESPAELEGTYVPMSARPTRAGYGELVEFPNNISLASQTRFRMYTTVRDIATKISFPELKNQSASVLGPTTVVVSLVGVLLVLYPYFPPTLTRLLFGLFAVSMLVFTAGLSCFVLEAILDKVIGLLEGSKHALVAK